ncbi:hypothetical protein ACOMHN_025471 [Nucella lapillus]
MIWNFLSAFFLTICCCASELLSDVEVGVCVGGLPVTAPVAVVEVVIQYNLLFGLFLQARCLPRVEQVLGELKGTSLLSARSQSLLWSLHKVQKDVGMTVTQTTDENDDNVERVGEQLLALLHALPLTGADPVLRQCVSLLACLWGLLTLLEKGKSSPLPWLSPLAESPVLDERMELKFGFLVDTSPPVVQPATEIKGSNPSSRGTINNFAHLLLATTSFHNQRWQECKEYVGQINGILWSPLADVLKGGALLGEGDSPGAIRHLQGLGRRRGLSPAVLCQVHRVMAACYNSQSLPTLALHQLSQCQSLRPQSPAVILLLAEQARLASDSADLELSCLKSLVEVEEKNQDNLPSVSESLLPELLLEVIRCEHRPSLTQALYRLATRCSCLKRYEDASQAFLRLIKVYQVLDAVSCSTLFSEQSLDDTCSQPTLATVTALFGTQLKGDILRSGGRKRKRSSGEWGEVEEGGRGSGSSSWWHEENRTLLVLCLAECLVVQGDYAGAVRVLNRAIECLNNIFPRCPATLPPETKTSRLNPKQSHCNPSQFANTGETRGQGEEEESSWKEVSHRVFVSLCDALCREGHNPCWGQVVRMARQALQVKPVPNEVLCSHCFAVTRGAEEEAGLYYMLTGMKKAGGRVEGCETWLRLRGLPHNTGSVLLQSAIHDTEKTIRTLAEDKSDRRLGILSDKQKASLDLLCLKALANARTNK